VNLEKFYPYIISPLLLIRFSVLSKGRPSAIPIWTNISFQQYTKITKKMSLCRIIYYSLAALHVSSDIFAHYQEH